MLSAKNVIQNLIRNKNEIIVYIFRIKYKFIDIYSQRSITIYFVQLTSLYTWQVFITSR